MRRILRISIFLTFVLFFFSASSIFAQSSNIVWRTQQVSLTADKMEISVGGKTYIGNNSVVVSSDPGDKSYTTLESIWKENGVEMRLFIYFAQSGGRWQVTEMRTYNGRTNGDWLYYEGFEGASTGEPYTKDKVVFTDKTGSGKISFTNLALSAFTAANIPATTTGFYLESTVSPNTVLISTEPNTGYGVNVLLKDKQGNIVVNQKNTSYTWNIDNPEIARYAPGSLCVYGITGPCPLMHVDVSGIRVGQTRITVSATSEGRELASTSIPVAVVAHGEAKEATSDEVKQLSQELQETKQDIKELKQEQSTLRRMLEEILTLIRNLF